ncbi:MAG: hypothetical protein GX796_06525 [Clostridiaceae bacterium]|nr:hypothetical protein [Clostridiaceae bacterium]
MRIKRNVLQSITIIIMVCCIVYPSLIEAGPIKWIKTRVIGRQEPNTKAVCVGASAYLHLGAVRDIIVDMDTPCQRKNLKYKSDFIGEIRHPIREIIYSYSEGGVNISTYPDDTQHLFRGLVLINQFQKWGEVSQSQRVTASDIPSGLFFDLVFINACHAGDTALDYEDGDGGSRATDFRNKFNSTVYIAPRGGNNGNPIVHYCSKCAYGTTARKFAKEFFNAIREARADNQNSTFGDIKAVWDPEDNPDPESSLYIMRGKSTKILTVFPLVP